MDAIGIVEAFRRAAFGMGSWRDAMAIYGAAHRANVVQVGGVDGAGVLAFNMLLGAGPDQEAAYMALRGADPRHNPRTAAALVGPRHVAVADDDFSTARERDARPLYRELFYRTGADHICQLPLALDGGAAALSAMRHRHAGPPTADERRLANTVGPAISGIVSQAFAMGTAWSDTFVETAEALSPALILLDRDMRPVSLSPSADAVLRAGTHLTLRHGRVVATTAGDGVTFERAFAGAIDPRRALAGRRRHVLRGPHASAPMTIELSPLPQRSSGPLSSACAMLAIRTERPPDAALLRAAFGLTEAEAAIALLLAEGLPPAAIARRRGSSVGTVRSQLKQILAKTETTRQAELVVRLHRIL